jgi:hypothetical protein
MRSPRGYNAAGIGRGEFALRLVPRQRAAPLYWRSSSPTHSHMSPTLSMTKVPLEVPHDWGTTCFTTEMHLLDPFFMKRRSPLDPELSRTLTVLFLTYSQELTLGSGISAQLEHVVLLFSIKLVRLSSNFFDLDANFFGIWPFLNFWERLLDSRVFSSGILALSAFWQEGLSFPRLVLRIRIFFY